MFDPDADPSRHKRERWWRGLFIVLATVYVALLLAAMLVDILGGFTRILLILFIAWLLAFVLSPVVGWISERFRIGRGAAIGLVYGATLVGSGFLLFSAATALGAELGKMAADFPLTRARIEGALGEWSEALAFGNFQPNFVELYRDVEVAVGASVGSMLGEVPEVTLGVLGSLVLVVILSLYMLADSASILTRFQRLVPARYSAEAEILERNVSVAFGGFLRAQVILAGIQTGLTIAAVVALDLPYGFLIVSASALAMLIPFFGPPLALMPAILATAIFNPGWLIPVAVVLLVVQTLLVNYLQPRLMRDALGIHPILVLVGLLVGSQIAGLWGALFGIPILAVLNVFFTYAVNLRAIEETPAVELEEVLEEVRQEQPDASPEEVVAAAADRVDAATNETPNEAEA